MFISWFTVNEVSENIVHIFVQMLGRLDCQSSNISGVSVRMGGNIMLVRGQGPLGWPLTICDGLGLFKLWDRVQDTETLGDRGVAKSKKLKNQHVATKFLKNLISSPSYGHFWQIFTPLWIFSGFHSFHFLFDHSLSSPTPSPHLCPTGVNLVWSRWPNIWTKIWTMFSQTSFTVNQDMNEVLTKHKKLSV